MPRKTRKRLAPIDEDVIRADREEGYRRLEIELHRAWRWTQRETTTGHDQ